MPIDTTRASLELLINISRELATSLDLSTTLGRVLQLCTNNVAAERGSLIMLDEHLDSVDAAIVISGQLIPNAGLQMQATLDKGLAGWVKRNRLPVLLPDTSLDKRWLRRPDDTNELSGPKSAICIPLMYREELIGVLTIVHSVPGFFNREHLALLQSIANQAGIYLYNARLHESLQVAHARYLELFEESIDSILITDQEGKILEANRQVTRVTGFSREELTGKLVFDLNQDQLQKVFEPAEFAQSLEKLHRNETITCEAQLQQRNNGSIPVQISVRQINQGSTVFFQWIFRDISERKALDELREDMTAMIYHDLRAPLSNIISSLDMLQALKYPETNPNMPSLLAIANRSTDRMQRLINSLLDISRLEDGRMITEMKPLAVQDLLLEAVNAVQPNLESKSQQLSVHVPPDFPNLKVDGDMIKRVLINLLENASKFTPLLGKLEISFRKDGDWAQIIVDDNGPGIPETERQAVFEKFTRLNPHPRQRGLGLGLAFCRLAVQAHGGKIRVESSPSGGSRFTFTLPLVVSG